MDSDPTTVELAEQAVVDPLLDQLHALPGVTVTELAPAGTVRQFSLLVTQPVDHTHPGGATFQQRVVIRSRGVALPTTLVSTGYGLFGSVPRDNEISFLLGGNAITVEHRYYEGSVPDADTRYLTIKQAAADHHRIVQLLRPIWTGKWISTGGSKGGMTSIYHRRFYPNDVDATVAYVAPQSYSTNDPRYGVFLEHVGSAACRQKIVDYQKAFLDRRDELLPIFDSFGFTYTTVGGLPMVYEHAVEEFRFAFWQYYDESLCDQMPASPAAVGAEDLAFLLDVVAGPEVLGSDQSLVDFGAYYYQAATQLGSYGPLSLERHIKSRLEFPGTYRVERYSTYPITKVDPFAMFDIQLWLATAGKRVMLVYGQNDPWSAGAFALGLAQDSYRYDVPGGNHGSFITQLPEPAQSEALATLARWANSPIVPFLAPAAANENARSSGTTEWQEDRARRVPL
jgi:PS-10 peptidase S37